MIYTFFRLLGMLTGYPAQLLFFKRRTYYEDKAATDLRHGGKLIICNHFSVVDYVMSAFLVFPRKLNAVCAEFPFKYPIARFGMRFFGAIQANRQNRSMRFVDESAACLRKGELVQIFPEGHNTPDGKMHEFKRSYIVIAHRAKVPIVPMITDGNYSLFKRTHVIIGREIDVSQFITSTRPTPTREELERANDYIYAKMLALQEELERRKTKKARR